VAVFGSETDAAEFASFQGGSRPCEAAQGTEHSFVVSRREICIREEPGLNIIFHRLKKKARTTRRIGNGTLSFAVIVILPVLAAPIAADWERRSRLIQRDTGQLALSPTSQDRSEENFAGFSERAAVSVCMIISKIEPYNK
jgi:hypothetical protein